MIHSNLNGNAGGGIRTHELLRDQTLNLAPLTKLGDPCLTLRATGRLHVLCASQEGLANPAIRHPSETPEKGRKVGLGNQAHTRGAE